ncbi:DUF1801 domain-containing protein [Pseudomonadota bacterium]
MSSNKTVETDDRVENFINTVDNEQKRKDSWDMIALMKKITGAEPKMWGSSLVGFGQYHYKYESGREGDFFITGFSPRKTAFTVYIMPGFDAYEEQMARLGPHKTGKSCLYLKNLDVVDREVLKEIIEDSVGVMHERYDCKQAGRE